MARTIALDFDNESTKKRHATRKSVARRTLSTIEDFDWLQSEADLQFVKIIVQESELIADLASILNQGTTSHEVLELLPRVTDISGLVADFAKREQQAFSSDVTDALRCVATLLEQAANSLLCQATSRISQSSSRGGATAIDLGGTETNLLTPGFSPNGSVAAPCSAKPETSEGAEVMTLIATIYSPDGPAGSVHVDMGHRVRIALSGEWSELAQQLNEAIARGDGFFGSDGGVCRIDNDSRESLAALEFVIGDESRGNLHLKPAKSAITE